ncbi:glycosyltransferase family 4 protein [soil metagenome]
MKVLYLLDTLNRGGAEMQVLDVCRNAADFDIDLTLATFKSGAMEADFRASGAEFIKLNRRFPLDIYLASQIRKIIKEREIEIVHGYQAVEGLHLHFAARGLRKVKKVLSFQGFLTDKKNRLTLKYLIPRMDANIVVSRGLQKWHAEIDRLNTENFKVIYNGADEKRLRPSGKSLRHELNLDNNALLIGMVGNFYRAERKDHQTLVKSLPKVFAEFPNAHCIFAGKIEAGAEDKVADCINLCIKHKIIERVHFLGARSDVPDILDALDVFVFSSLHEGLPVAVSEAMLAKVPMIVSDIEPLLEVSGNGKYAEVFEVKNAEMLSEKILKLLKDTHLRKNLADRALEFAKENFSIEAHLRELKKLYDSILQK